jgi:hypothetical protein
LWHRGCVSYWWFFRGTRIRRLRQFPHAIELAILDYHFRPVAQRFQDMASAKPFADACGVRC